MNRQEFLKHLIELRGCLIRCFVFISLVLILLLPFASDLFSWYAKPLLQQLPQGQSLIATNIPAPLFMPIKLVLFISVVVSMPYVLYQLWRFVAPGLYEHERRLVWVLLSMSLFLFYLGLAFSYLIVFPLIFKFIISFAPAVVLPTPDISEYISFSLKLFFAFALGFEVPVITLVLIYTGVTTAADLKKSRRYVIVGAFIIGMVMTPPDVISQLMLAIPIWLLFELGLVLSTFIVPRKLDSSVKHEP